MTLDCHLKADDPYFRTRIIFKKSPRNATLSLYFKTKVPAPNSEDDRDPSMTRNELSALVLCFLDHLFLFLTFASCHSGIFSNFAFFHHCRLCIWNFRMLTHWNLFAHKTVMSYRIRSFRNNVFLPILRWVSSLLLVGILQALLLTSELPTFCEWLSLRA